MVLARVAVRWAGQGRSSWCGDSKGVVMARILTNVAQRGGVVGGEFWGWVA